MIPLIFSSLGTFFSADFSTQKNGAEISKAPLDCFKCSKFIYFVDK